MAAWEGGDPECEHQRPVSHHDNTYYEANKQTIPCGWRQNGGNATYRRLGKCGAAAAGIGLEPTLGEWVAEIVAVSREVWRVLRDDGTFWLNLGDAYDSGTSAKRQASNNVDVGYWQGAAIIGGNRVNAGLGAKQLMGQPWRVAQELQKPFHIADQPGNRSERVLAGLIDADGSIGYVANLRLGRTTNPVHSAYLSTKRTPLLWSVALRSLAWAIISKPAGSSDYRGIAHRRDFHHGARPASLVIRDIRDQTVAGANSL